VSTQLQLKNIGQVIELIKVRDLRIQDILLKKSWDDLDLQQPKPESEADEADKK